MAAGLDANGVWTAETAYVEPKKVTEITMMRENVEYAELGGTAVRMATTSMRPLKGSKSERYIRARVPGGLLWSTEFLPYFTRRSVTCCDVKPALSQYLTLFPGLEG